MAKGDFSSVKIDSFGKGINLVDPIEEMDVGYLGPLTRNVLPAGNGKSLHHSQGVLTTLNLSASATKRPAEITKYANGVIVAFADGSVDRIVQSTGVSTNFAGTDVIAVPDVAISQDSALTDYFAYVLRPKGSATVQAKFNLTSGVGVTWPGTPPLGTCLISWKTMMVIGQGSRLRFSTQGNPDSWPANNFIDIKTLDDALDDIVGFEIMGENLMVFKKRSTWIVFDPVTFDNRRLFSVGILNRNCSTRLDDRVYWGSPEGFYSTDGDTLKYETPRLGAMSTVWQRSSASALTSSPNGTLIACDGNGLLLGYTQFRDINGQMPWYSCRDAGYARVKCIMWGSSDYSGASGLSDDPNFNAVVAGLWNSTGANSNGLGVCISVTGASSPPVVFPHEGGLAVKSIIQLPTLHNAEVEGLSRLRRLNLYGHGTLGTTGVAGIEVYKDNAGAPDFSQVGAAFSGEFLKYKPEVRGKNFSVILYSDGVNTDFELHTVEAEFRQAGR